MPITEANPILLVAACALVDVERQILVAERPPGKAMAGLWEFPGGKVEPNETPEQCLIRELKEELDIDVTESCLAPLTFASHSYEKFHLLMPLYVCRKWSGFIQPQEGQRVKWCAIKELPLLDMPPADRPLVAMLRDMI